MFVLHNENPAKRQVGDCTVRAISAALHQPWEKTYMGLAIEGLLTYDMPSANNVWSAYLRRNGWARHTLSDECPDCYTVSDFAREHKTGTYILALPKHVVCICQGDLLDTWDSSDELVLYYWTKEG